MALYSKDYDLYLGGQPQANSQYRIHDAPQGLTASPIRRESGSRTPEG
jgi:hypothetical protein